MGQVIGVAGASLEGAQWAASRDAAAVGLNAERLTAAELVGAVERGATVLHDLRIPIRGITANIDHAVVSGDAVTLIDSKWWAPGVYWTVGGRTRRGLRLAPHADAGATAIAQRAIAALLRRRGVGVLADPVTVVWAKHTPSLRLYRPSLGIAIPGERVGAWTRSMAMQPANRAVVAALRTLVKEP